MTRKRERHSVMHTLSARVVPWPTGQKRLVVLDTGVPRSSPGPLLRESGHFDVVCGSCRATLLEQVEADRMDRLVIRCPACGALNEGPLRPA